MILKKKNRLIFNGVNKESYEHLNQNIADHESPYLYDPLLLLSYLSPDIYFL
jgi:hypothetical protein